jgi:hypothetical protein
LLFLLFCPWSLFFFGVILSMISRFPPFANITLLHSINFSCLMVGTYGCTTWTADDLLLLSTSVRCLFDIVSTMLIMYYVC